MIKTLHQRNRKRGTDFSRYIYAVLVQVSREQGHEVPQISGKAMMTMNSFVQDLYMRIATQAVTLMRYNNRSTLSARDIQAAARLVLPEELARHAISEGTKAIVRYNESTTADPLTPGARKAKKTQPPVSAIVV